MVLLNRNKDTFTELKSALNIVCLENADFFNTFFKPKKNIKNPEPLFILIFSNRGFCGNFNDEIITTAQKFADKNNIDFENSAKIIIGKKRPSYLKISKNDVIFEPQKDFLSI